MWDAISQIVTKVFRSKALILGWVTFLSGVLSFAAGHDFVAQYPEVVSILVSLVGALTMVIRVFTYLPLDVKESLND